MSPQPLPSGPFTFDMVVKRGITRYRLDRLLAVGEVVEVCFGVYIRGDVELTVGTRAAAVALVVKPHQVACDRTAAWIHGVDVFTYAELGEGPAIELCARDGGPACERKGIEGHTRMLRNDEVMRIGALLVTTPLRTVLDLGCILERRDALATLDAFRRLHGLRTSELATAAARFAGRRGVVQLREVIHLSDPRAESPRESWTRITIHDAGLPAPDLQHWILVDGVQKYRVDLCYPYQRIAIEYDGFDAHERTAELIEATAERRRWLRANGWTVVVVRRGDFTGAGLERWLHELREALRPTYSNKRPLERGAKAKRWLEGSTIDD